MTTVLLAQRVSHKFKAVIEGSLPLQKKLFFVPVTFKEAVVLAEGGDEGLRNCVVDEDDDVYLDDDLDPIMLNPALIKHFAAWGVKDNQIWRKAYSPQKLPVDTKHSFLRMYLAGPMPRSWPIGIQVKSTSGRVMRRLHAVGSGKTRTLMTVGQVIEQMKQVAEDQWEGEAILHESSLFWSGFSSFFTIREARESFSTHRAPFPLPAADERRRGGYRGRRFQRLEQVTGNEGADVTDGVCKGGGGDTTTRTRRWPT